MCKSVCNWMSLYFDQKSSIWLRAIFTFTLPGQKSSHSDVSSVQRQPCTHVHKTPDTLTNSKIKDNIVRFTLNLMPPDLIPLLIEQIASAVNAIRPERTFIRDRDLIRKRRKRHHVAYKRVG